LVVLYNTSVAGVRVVEFGPYTAKISPAIKPMALSHSLLRVTIEGRSDFHNVPTTCVCRSNTGETLPESRSGTGIVAGLRRVNVSMAFDCDFRLSSLQL